VRVNQSREYTVGEVDEPDEWYYDEEDSDEPVEVDPKLLRMIEDILSTGA
jgi:hypothetical protein